MGDTPLNFSDLLVIKRENDLKKRVVAQLGREIGAGNDFELCCKTTNAGVFHDDSGHSVSAFIVSGHTRRTGRFMVYAANGPRGITFGDDLQQAVDKALSI